MGAGRAGSLVREGHQVTIWNRTESRAHEVDRGVEGDMSVAASVAEAVADCDVVLTMLFDEGGCPRKSHGAGR